MKKIVVSILCIMMLTTLSGCNLVEKIIRNVFDINQEQPIMVSRDQSIISYKVKQINADANPMKSSSTYFWDDYENPKEYIYQYCPETKELESFEVENLYDYAGNEDELFYSTKTDEGGCLFYYNFATAEKKELTEKLVQEKKNEQIYVAVCNGYFIYEISYQSIREGTVFICPLGGDFQSERIEIGAKFEEDKSGDIYYMEYMGLIFGRFYKWSQYYDIFEVRDKQTNQMVALRKDRYGKPKDDFILDEIVCQGKTVGFFSGVGSFDDASDFTYQIKGEDEILPIGCLDYDTYKEARIQETKLTVEEDKIIGLFSVSSDSRYTVDNAQYILRKDVLFQLDPITGESSILYDTVDNWTRIIGYREGVLYLLKDGQIYESTLEGEQLSVLFELPSKTDNYTFVWQGEYLLIVNMTQPGVIDSVKVY